MALNMDLAVNMNIQYTKAAVAGNFPLDPVAFAKRILLATGTAAGQADKLYYAERTITAGASSETLDLSGTLTDNFGATFTIARIKLFAVVAESATVGAVANTNDTVIGAAAANQWVTFLNSTGTATLKPGGLLVAACGAADATCWTVTGGTGDQLKVANSAGAGGANLTYQIYVVASSA